MTIQTNHDGIDRNMTPEEVAEYAAFQTLAKKDRDELAADIETRASILGSARAKLAALGLTETEIDAFLAR